MDGIFKKFRNESEEPMNFELNMEDYAIILNALHYYKKVEKRGNFKQYNEERVNKLRDKMAYQLVPSPKCKPE